LDGADLAVRTENGAEIVEALKDVDAVICVSRIFSGEHLMCEIGQRYSFRNPMVRADPEAFVPVLRASVDPASARRCIAAIDIQSDGPGAAAWHTRRLAWPGQLFDRHDQLVLAYPDRFAEEPC
jgi:hypothetical protein